MKKVNLFLVISVALSLIVCLSGCGGTPITPPIEEDFINIISVTPDSGLVDGVETYVSVVVEYSLVSGNLGVLQIGFNNVCDSAGLPGAGCYIQSYRFGIYENFLVNKGSGTHEFNVTIIPKDYGSQGDFKALATLTQGECYIVLMEDIQLVEIGGDEICSILAIDDEILTFQ